jgi:hypothetical protein
MTGVSARDHFGAHAEGKEVQAQRLRDLLHLRHVAIELLRGFVDRPERRAGQFELAARFKRNRTAVLRVRKADRVIAFEDRIPAAFRLKAVEQRANAVVSVVGNGRMIGAVEGDLLVFRAEAPCLAGLLARGDPVNELIARDRRRIGNVAGHPAPLLMDAMGTAAPRSALDRAHGARPQ